MRRISSALVMLASASVAQTPPSAAPAPIPGVVNENIDPAVVVAATAQAETGGLGPFKAEMLSDPRLRTHTLYRPRNLAAAGKLPIVAWGNGACTNIGNRFRYLLTDIASHGYLVLAIGPVGPREVEYTLRIAGGGSPGDRVSHSQAAQLIDAINWAITENGRKGSPYFGRLDTSKIAVAGQSCGGLQAVAAAADPRVRTTLVLDSGTFPVGAPELAGTGDANKASLRRFHSPVAYLSGDESDIAFKNANADFDAIDNVPVFRGWKHGIGHAEHFRAPGGGPLGPVMAAWLDWQLKGDLKARAWFVGPHCRLCSDASWTMKSKKLP